MKVTITNGVVTATSESKLEALQLVSLSFESKTLAPETKVRKHKKHNFVKKCDRCGKGYKGNIGLGIHKAKCHKVSGVPVGGWLD